VRIPTSSLQQKRAKDIVGSIITALVVSQRDQAVANKVRGLTNMYSVRLCRFLEDHNTLTRQGVRSGDTVIMTDCRDAELMAALALAASIPANKLVEPSRPRAKALLVIRGLVKGIPYVDHAVDALLFGRGHHGS